MNTGENIVSISRVNYYNLIPVDKINNKIEAENVRPQEINLLKMCSFHWSELDTEAQLTFCNANGKWETSATGCTHHERGE